MPDSFYVYELIDPRSGVVFYVGKGCGKRDRSHMSEAKRGDFKNPAKIALIRMIEAEGHQVEIRRVVEGLTEREAFKAERQHIARHGMANLTNMMRGQTTEHDRAEAMAMDGLRVMGSYIAAGVADSRVFQIIRELRQNLKVIRQEA